jgi:pimeloyl-ACP methyl ester carboxylesterase
LSVDGIALEFQHLPGDTTKPTLVLLHEGMGCIELWRDFPQQLAAATGSSNWQQQLDAQSLHIRGWIMADPRLYTYLVRSLTCALRPLRFHRRY